MNREEPPDACFLGHNFWQTSTFLTADMNKRPSIEEDLFLGGQLSIILGYRRLSVKFSCLLSISLFSKPKDVMISVS